MSERPVTQNVSDRVELRGQYAGEREQKERNEELSNLEKELKARINRGKR